MTSSEQCGLVQLIWAGSLLSFSSSWKLHLLLFSSCCVSCSIITCVDNTTLFPMALFSEFFWLFLFELCFSTARLCDAIHEVERGRMREEKSYAGVDAQGDYCRPKSCRGAGSGSTEVMHRAEEAASLRRVQFCSRGIEREQIHKASWMKSTGSFTNSERYSLCWVRFLSTQMLC